MADSDNLYGVIDQHNPGDDPYHIPHPPPPQRSPIHIPPVVDEVVVSTSIQSSDTGSYAPNPQMSPTWTPETHPAGPPAPDPSTYDAPGTQPAHWTEL